MNDPVRLLSAGLLLGTCLLLSDPAAAFRCGSKLVVDGMHEAEVLAICGEPATRRHIGYAVRPYDPRRRYRREIGWGRRYDPGFGHLTEEVIVTEFVYNFGPRRLMQRLIFEGGLLVDIETLGYGY